MSLTVICALGCALSLAVGWWLSRAASRVERQALLDECARAQKGSAEWAQLAVQRQAVITTLEARAVEDAARLGELRAQLESAQAGSTL